MRHRRGSRFDQTATLERRTQVDANELGEPVYETTTVADGVRCRFDDSGTSFVREDSGERVQRPARVIFGHDVAVQSGDTIAISGGPGPFEARGIERIRDHRRGRVDRVEVEVERA